MKKASYEVVIIGGGPAGLTTAIYAQRAGLRTLVIEKMIAGGQMNLILTLENYPGFASISGSDLADKMYAQAQNLGVEFLFDEINSVDLSTKVIATPELTIQSKVIIIATGAGPRKLTAQNATPFLNNGIHYCATCDGPLYKGKAVVVVGGNDQALADALFLAAICRSVTIVNPAPDFFAKDALVQAVAEQSNLQVYQQHNISQILGEHKITGVKIKNTVTGAETQIVGDAVFVALGRMPNIELCPSLALGKTGYVQTDADCATNIPGVYAVGDVREKSCRQVVTAAADGAVAATAAVVYLRTIKEEQWTTRQFAISLTMNQLLRRLNFIR